MFAIGFMPRCRLLRELLKTVYPIGAAMGWKTTSPGHAYGDIFNRRLKRGQCFTIPFLGWKEFGPSYFGTFRETTKVQSDINMVIPSMLREVFSEGYASKCAFTYEQDVRIRRSDGVFQGRRLTC